MNHFKLNYRYEIDGLRAIAVLAVILYHAEFSLFETVIFQGGYLGVDIFFVISGYLITNIILSELYHTGFFNLKNFYERRARRILPMLFLILLVSIPFAWKILLPNAFIEFAESIFTSIFFSSNFYFYFTTTEYGAESSLLKPLLHTWSLGVEEQFYIMFPFLALAVFKYAKKYLLQILFLLLLISLFYAEFMEQRNPELNFFIPLSRVWELAVGSILAYKEINYKEKINTLQKLLPSIGLLLIFYSFYLFQEKTPHPSFITTIPIIGAALIIGYSSSSELVGKFLSSKPMVGMGLISYSAYLWHFPIFAFYRNQYITESLEIKFALILCTIVLSVITYITIEKPFRNKNRIPLNKIKSIFVITFLFFMAFVIATNINKGFETRFHKIQGFENYEIDNVKLRKISWSLIKEKKYFDENAVNKILIIGNSHGKDFFNAMYQNLDLVKDIDFVYYRGVHTSCFDDRIDRYKEVQKTFFNSNLFKKSNALIISNRFFKNNKGRCGIIDNDVGEKGNVYRGMSNLIKIAKKNNKKIILLGTTAEFKAIEKQHIVDYVFKNNKYFNNEVLDEINKLYFKNLRNFEKTKKINAKLKKFAIENNIFYFDKTFFICDFEIERCKGILDKGSKSFYDYGHWTLEGAKYFGKLFLKNKEFKKTLYKN